mmetsp:Transcript_71531/g.190233  ORF Transcript_71531/g.190233 Transcript_71531/m.190233 type:complete len:289 (-) Transcript_71531:800-1666(-)
MVRTMLPPSPEISSWNSSPNRCDCSDPCRLDCALNSTAVSTTISCTTLLSAAPSARLPSRAYSSRVPSRIPRTPQRSTNLLLSLACRRSAHSLPNASLWRRPITRIFVGHTPHCTSLSQSSSSFIGGSWSTRLQPVQRSWMGRGVSSCAAAASSASTSSHSCAWSASSDPAGGRTSGCGSGPSGAGTAAAAATKCAGGCRAASAPHGSAAGGETSSPLTIFSGPWSPSKNAVRSLLSRAWPTAVPIAAAAHHVHASGTRPMSQTGAKVCANAGTVQKSTLHSGGKWNS